MALNNTFSEHIFFIFAIFSDHRTHAPETRDSAQSMLSFLLATSKFSLTGLLGAWKNALGPRAKTAEFSALDHTLHPPFPSNRSLCSSNCPPIRPSTHLWTLDVCGCAGIGERMDTYTDDGLIAVPKTCVKCVLVTFE